MESPRNVRIAYLIAAALAAPHAARAQAPDTLRLTAKVRDFREIPNAAKPPSIPGTHPDFNAFGNCGGKNYVHTRIDTTASRDQVNFPEDNRTPRLLPYLNTGNVRTDCFTSFERFDEWYNDKDTSINRPFLHDLVFTRMPSGMYEYRNRLFFPVNDDSLRLGRTRNLEGNNLTTFGHLNQCCKQNNYGFTTEFHARFTYLASEDTSKQQVFTFSGDDDVWIFINDTLVFDLGGLHTADPKSIKLDPATAGKLKLEHGKTYMLDFFLAERSIFESNCIITTSLVLETRGPITRSTVKKAYIKDANGDGRGDKVYLEFSEKLPELPDRITAQWNGPSTPVQAPRLAFVTGDSMMVEADYSGIPFGAGLTAIAEGAIPRAFLPDDARFRGQDPRIEDSIGPVLLSARKKPADIEALAAGDPGFYHDTLFLTVSEPLKPSANLGIMVKFAVTCDEYAEAIPLTAVVAPASDPDHPREYVFVIDGKGISPQVGHCLFLNADPGKLADLQGNPPPVHGIKLEGENAKDPVLALRGHPPVAGADPNSAVAERYRREASGGAGGDGITWIAPVGYEEGNPFIPYTVDDPRQVPDHPPEKTATTLLPEGISAIQVKASSPFVARIRIFDNHGVFVKSMEQAFGYRGEILNPARMERSGYVSYLVWDMKDARGQAAGQGVYVWKVRFRFADGTDATRSIRIGVLRGK